MALFVDMDGVLADFDTHYESLFGRRPDKDFSPADWKDVRKVGNFYLNIPPMKDFDILWGFVLRLNPVILTGVPKSIPEAASNKISWAERWCPGTEIRCCLSKEKYLHANPGDILIDDWVKYQSLWVEAGGVWITHVSAKATIAQLELLAFEKR